MSDERSFGLTGTEISLLTLVIFLIGVVIAFVRDMAVKHTTHELRLGALEKNHDRLASAIDRLTATLHKIDKHLFALDKEDARRSQGQFGQVDSDYPPKE